MTEFVSNLDRHDVEMTTITFRENSFQKRVFIIYRTKAARNYLISAMFASIEVHLAKVVHCVTAVHCTSCAYIHLLSIALTLLFF